jgi:hypothetical protein
MSIASLTLFVLLGYASAARAQYVDDELVKVSNDNTQITIIRNGDATRTPRTMNVHPDCKVIVDGTHYSREDGLPKLQKGDRIDIDFDKNKKCLKIKKR